MGGDQIALAAFDDSAFLPPVTYIPRVVIERGLGPGQHSGILFHDPPITPAAAIFMHDLIFYMRNLVSQLIYCEGFIKESTPSTAGAADYQPLRYLPHFARVVIVSPPV